MPRRALLCLFALAPLVASCGQDDDPTLDVPQLLEEERIGDEYDDFLDEKLEEVAPVGGDGGLVQ